MRKSQKTRLYLNRVGFRAAKIAEKITYGILVITAATAIYTGIRGNVQQKTYQDLAILALAGATAAKGLREESYRHQTNIENILQETQ